MSTARLVIAGARPFVLFAATAGPRRGFGHLVRCGVLADGLDVNRTAMLHGASRAAERAARRLGWSLTTWPRATARRLPDLLVVDDPSAARTGAWVRRARTHGVAVATIHDGLPPQATPDLAIDGSAVSRHADDTRRVAGPSFVILRDADPRRSTRLAPVTPPRVLVALGGGAHVRHVGARVAAAIARRRPDATVDLAAGFMPGRLPRLPSGCRWIAAPDGLADALAGASVSVVAGGITLYEACALGTPAVAVAVVRAQQPAIDAVVRARAALTTRLDGPDGADRVARLVCELIDQPVLRRTLRRNAQRLIDGRGAARVVARLSRLIHRHRRDAIDAVA